MPAVTRWRATPGSSPPTVATPLSVVLNELLQNAIDHAFPSTIDLQAEPGRVVVKLRNDGHTAAGHRGG